MHIEDDVVAGGDELSGAKRAVIGGGVSGQIAVLRGATGAAALLENGFRGGIGVIAAGAASDEGRAFFGHGGAFFIAGQIGPHAVAVFYVGTVRRVADANVMGDFGMLGPDLYRGQPGIL